MKALVTGGGGLCGRFLLRYLDTIGIEAHTLSTKSTINHHPHHQISDLLDAEAIKRILKSIKPDYIFHLAGVMHTGNPSIFYKVNTQFAVTIFYAMEKADIVNSPILIVGTSAEYGVVLSHQLPISEELSPHPYNHYGISKLAQTLEGLAYYRKGHPVVIVRPFNIIGPNMNKHLVVQNIVSQIAMIKKGIKEPVIEVGNLNSKRDFIDVRDVVEIYWKLINSPSAYGEIINICTGESVSIKQILTTLTSLTQVEAEIRVKPSLLKPIDIPDHYGNTAKLKRILGYVPSLDIKASLSLILQEEIKNELFFNYNLPCI